tara:strand:+ start:108 stop:707 length:600 start_codon:yes stop_codon:yes gene_type:complete
MKLLFSSVIHEIPVKNFKSIKKKLMDFVYDQQQRDSKGVVFSNSGGWQSQSLYHSYDNILRETIRASITSYFRGVFTMDGYSLCNLWMNINKKGDRNVPHDHPLADLSGVLWINTPKGCGNIEFQSPQHFNSAMEIEMYTEDFRKKTNCYAGYWIPPQEGNILLFPASLVHMVNVCQSDEDRISAAFNLKIGSLDEVIG